jgi:hypothetical protein
VAGCGVVFECRIAQSNCSISMRSIRISREVLRQQSGTADGDPQCSMWARFSRHTCIIARRITSHPKSHEQNIAPLSVGEACFL